MLFLFLPNQQQTIATKYKSLDMKKFLIAGLGNIGPAYKNTRHNIGFKILDALAKQADLSWETVKLGDITTHKKKGAHTYSFKTQHLYES